MTALAMTALLAINLSAGVAVIDDGQTIPLTNLLDGDGEETSDLREVVSVVFPYGAQWYAVRVAAFPPLAVN